jgi:feruloyl-CoA synthase
VGLPVPGTEAKLVPVSDKYELRIRSRGTTPGYLNDPQRSKEAFDEDGFFKMGDAVRFADPEEYKKGLCFAGRIAEEFKLQTGTWVSAGTLRAEIVTATSPYVRDVVVCGINETFIALLVWPNLASCAKFTGTEDIEQILASAAVKDVISKGMRQHNNENSGSSRRIRRYLLLADPPNLGEFEITDKGYINQNEVQNRRAKDVSRLFAELPDDQVVILN